MWTNLIVNFPPTNAGTKLFSVHEYSGLKQIKSIQPSCPCVSYRYKNKVLTLEWKTKKDVETSYVSFKYVTITYKDGTTSEINLRAPLVKV